MRLKVASILPVLSILVMLGIISSVYGEPGISVIVTDVKPYINASGDVAIYIVTVESLTTEDENVRVTISGDPELAFNWTQQEFLLAAGESVSFGLEVTYSGSSPGDFQFTALGEAWPTFLTYDQASQMGLIETSSYTDYVHIPPSFVIPIAPAGTITLGILMIIALTIYTKLPRRE